MKTKYIYKGEEILHSTFISLCRKIGVNGGRKFTTLEKLQQEANKGNEKAIELLSNLQICLLYTSPSPIVGSVRCV